MQTKDGVTWETLRPEMQRLEPVVGRVFAAFDLRPVCTSTNDGTHCASSLHYHDLAFDLRCHQLAPLVARSLWTSLRDHVSFVYPGQYDVLLEYVGTPSQHLHVEASPKLLAALNAPAYQEERV
jgi:hypothetical protein